MTATLDKFSLLSRIGVGGTAEIFLADMRGPEGFRKRVALKVLLPQFAADADFRSMFINEARLVANIAHDNVVQVYELGQWQQRFWIAMDYVPGPDLGRVLEKLREDGRRMPVALAIFIARRLLRALSFAHTLRDADGQLLRIVHRDVSPSNVLFSPDGVPKLTDFGIAKATFSDLRTRSGILKGKFVYMSPEQAYGRPVDARADLFSVGALLYEMAAGAARFGRDDELALLKQARAAAHRPLREAAPELPDALCVVVEHALAADPAQRFQSATDFADALDALATGDLAADSTALADFLASVDLPQTLDADFELDAPLPPPRRKRPRWPLVAGAALVAATAFVAWPRAHRVVATRPPDDPAPVAAVAAAPIALPAPLPTTLPARIVVKAVPAIGFLTVNSDPWARVLIDGQLVTAETPLVHHALAAGRHQVILETRRGERRTLSVDIAAGHITSKAIRFSDPP